MIKKVNFSEDKKMLVYGLNKSYTDIFCFSTTRHGGYSTGRYSSLNCTHYCGDFPENVKKNKQVLVGILKCRHKNIIIPRQVHGTEVLVINEDFTNLSPTHKRERLEGIDAVVTNLHDICVCVSTADCIPVLLYDERNKAVAAIHAGWRGTVERIAVKTLDVMADTYGTRPKDVHAVIGPGISILSFEVGDDVYEAFSEAGFNMDVIARNYGKWHIDLWEANRLQLVEAGLDKSNIEVSGICTYINHEDFFSARYMGLYSGRMLSGIMLKG